MPNPQSSITEVKKPLEATVANPSIAETISDLSDDSYHFLLKESPYKLMFLSSLASLYIAKSFSLCAITIAYLYYGNSIRSYGRSFSIENFGILGHMLLAITYLLTGTVGYNFRPLLGIVFKVDLVIGMIAYWGILAYIDDYIAGQESKTYFEIALFFGGAYLFGAMGFAASIKMNKSQSRYNPFRGLGISVLGSSAGCITLYYLRWRRGYEAANIMYAVILCSVFLFYICVNSSFVLKHRQTKYFENDSYWAYFSFYTDILYRFWVDVLRIFKKKKTTKSENEKEDNGHKHTGNRSIKAKKNKKIKKNTDIES